MSSARVIVSLPGEGEHEIELSGGASIGRASDNSICVPEAGVSRYHALIEERADGFWLKDLNSANGTWLNGVRLSAEKRLRDGDLIRFGGSGSIAFICTEAGTAADDPSPAEPDQNSSGQKQRKSALGAQIAGAFAGLAIVGLFIAAVSGGYLPGTGSATPTPTQVVVEPPPVTPTVIVPGDDQTGPQARELAAIFSGTSGYVFDPAFLSRIRELIPQYLNYRLPDKVVCLEMADAFISVGGDGNKPMLGFTVALSESRFAENPAGNAPFIGYWKVPRAIAAGATALPPMLTPKLAAEVGAGYLKRLLGTFGREDFMYAIACYGRSLDEAGAVKLQLNRLDPSGTERRDFWRMWPRLVQQGAGPADGADRVARLFAAGIVAENPREYRVQAGKLSEVVR
ncbi:MAG TPA: FHA domain-containing protein [Blastocatellia bacterium]|nr:FHA domain-containing protein [Blastocatellia bacterium]